MALTGKLRRQGFADLADLLEALKANVSAARVVLTREALEKLRIKDAKTYARVLAWCKARGVEVVKVRAGRVLTPRELLRKLPGPSRAAGRRSKPEGSRSPQRAP